MVEINDRYRISNLELLKQLIILPLKRHDGAKEPSPAIHFVVRTGVFSPSPPRNLTQIRRLSDSDPSSGSVLTALAMRYHRSRRRLFAVRRFLFLFVFFSGFSLVLPTLRSIGLLDAVELPAAGAAEPVVPDADPTAGSPPVRSSCATVEEMGEQFAAGSAKESLRVRRIIERHFAVNGAAKVRELPPDQFCRQRFVLGKASEAGFGNEMYKILTAAALSVVLNRSLIIGQNRGKYPFGDYISYTNQSFTLKEVKHLWRQNDCVGKHGKHLFIRTDDFEKPVQTNILCSDWRRWKQPILCFQGTTDAVGVQFLLKNTNPGMRKAASTLFGHPRVLNSRPNVFGELMRFVISPSQAVQDAVDRVLNGGPAPDVSLHMRMMMNRPVRAVQAAVNCIKKALNTYQPSSDKPRIVLVSDTPSIVKDIKPMLTEIAEVLHFDYKLFRGNISEDSMNGAKHYLNFKTKDWGPSPRWVLFVDFFLASRAKHAVVSGSHRRVGTTYAQLIAALAAANQLGEDSAISLNFSFFSSFHSNLLVNGLRNQVGWGHVWNRYGGPLSCPQQSNQCAYTPLLPSAWWDDEWQSPIARDVRRLRQYGVHLTNSGEIDETHLKSFCMSRKDIIRTTPV
ncbi:uncharacterized protein [Aristolochia californica]|uniref:uncharacterized protein n=1 Tax=Aristolochia californica TaxID=171875 RepID=UPI0035DE67E1